MLSLWLGFVDIDLDMGSDKHFVVDKPAVVRFDPCRKARFDLVLVRLVAGQKKNVDSPNPEPRPSISSSDDPLLEKRRIP